MPQAGANQQAEGSTEGKECPAPRLSWGNFYTFSQNQVTCVSDGLPKVVCPRSKEGSKRPRGCLAVSQQPRAVLHFPKPAVLLHKVLGQPMPREERLGTSTLCPPGPCFKVRVAILPPEARLWCALSLSAAPDTQTQALTWLWGGRLKVCPPVAQPLDQLTAQPVLDHLYGSL